MGRCHEFGTQIRQGCQHPMRPGTTSCGCNECGVVCGGQFDGCSDVWARGSTPVTVTLRPVSRGGEELAVRPVQDPWESRSLFVPEPDRAGAMVGTTRTADSGRPPVDHRPEEGPARHSERLGRAAPPSFPPSSPPERPRASAHGTDYDLAFDAAGQFGPAAGEPGTTSRPAPEAFDPSGANGPMFSGPMFDRRGPTSAPRGDQEAVSRVPANSPASAPPNARVQLFRWFESEFSVLRTELHELVSAVAQQQAMVAELLEDRHAQLRLALLAESLPTSVEETVRTSVADNIGSVAERIGSVADDVGAVADNVGSVADDLSAVAERTEGAVEELRGSIERAESWAKERREDTELLDSALGQLRQGVLDLEGAVRTQQKDLASELPKLRALRSSLARQLRPLVEAVPSTVQASVGEALAVHQVALEERMVALVAGLHESFAQQLAQATAAQRESAEAQSGELRALKVSLARQLRPLSAAVERTMERGPIEAKPARAPRRRP